MNIIGERITNNFSWLDQIRIGQSLDFLPISLWDRQINLCCQANDTRRFAVAPFGKIRETNIRIVRKLYSTLTSVCHQYQSLDKNTATNTTYSNIFFISRALYKGMFLYPYFYLKLTPNMPSSPTEKPRRRANVSGPVHSEESIAMAAQPIHDWTIRRNIDRAIDNDLGVFDSVDEMLAAEFEPTLGEGYGRPVRERRAGR